MYNGGPHGGGGAGPAAQGAPPPGAVDTAQTKVSPSTQLLQFCRENEIRLNLMLTHWVVPLVQSDVQSMITHDDPGNFPTHSLMLMNDCVGTFLIFFTRRSLQRLRQQ